MQSKKFILGGGMAGLISAYINKDYNIISEQVGGQFASLLPLGPRFVKKTVHTEWLLKQLGFISKTKNVKVGYYDQGEVKNECSVEERRIYYFKTRGLKDVPVSAMSDGERQFKVFKISHRELLEKLKIEVSDRITIGRVIRIDGAASTLTVAIGPESKTFEYERIISTIPYPIFMEIAKNIQSKWFSAKYYPTYFAYCLCESDELAKKLKTGYDYVYIVSNDLPFHRVSPYQSGFLTESRFYKIPKGWKVLQREKMEIGQICGRIGWERFEWANIDFIGRYAQWAHDIRISQVVERARGISSGK